MQFLCKLFENVIIQAIQHCFTYALSLNDLALNESFNQCDPACIEDLLSRNTRKGRVDNRNPVYNFINCINHLILEIV